MMRKFIEEHKTLATGVTIAVLGTAQASLSTLQEFISPFAYAVTNIVLGLTVAGIGAYNTLKAKIAAARAADDDRAADEAGA